MSKKLVTPALGMIVSSPEFVFGFRNYSDPNIICVDGNTIEHLVEDHGVIHNYARVDPTRADAHYLIIEVVDESDKDFSQALRVRARRMTRNGRFNPKGEVIEFYFPYGYRANTIKNIRLHGQRTPTITWS